MRLTVELLERLRSPEGAELLLRAAALGEDPFAAQKLRRSAPEDLAAAAVEQVRLRGRALSRFSQADRMWFAGPLLEQASGEVISRWRARRYADLPGPVGDLCCGLGADSLALAAHARVLAVDRDPLALALTRANAEALGVADVVEARLGTVPRDAPAGLAGAWVDPGRREGGTRTRHLDAISPPLREVLSLLPGVPALGVKLSPATPEAELDAALAGIPHQRELISVSGECRELVVWTGALRGGPPRRATVLPEGVVLEGEPEGPAAVQPDGEWLLEPDAAVIRAGLVGNLARCLGAAFLDPRLAYLWVDGPVRTPLGSTYRVDPVERFSLRALSDRLRDLGASDVVIKTRGAAVEPEALRRQLRPVLKQGRTGIRPVVILTRVGDRAVMMLGERLGPE